MTNEKLLLLRTFLKATSGRNILKYSTDKKQKSLIRGSYIGFGLVYCILLIYVTAASFGLGLIGMADIIPGMCGIIIFAMSLFFTLLKSNGYLFAFKEYDMIMSMPFEVKDVVSSKFLYMYVKNLPMNMVLALAMMAGYEFAKGLNILTIILWVILAFFLPVIPMIIASALGTLVVKVGSRFQHKRLIQSVLTLIVLIPCMGSRFIIERFIRDGQMQDIMTKTSSQMENASTYIPTTKWFEKAINEHSIVSALLLIVVSVAVYELFFILVSGSYRDMNSRLMMNKTHGHYKVAALKSSSMVKAIAFKEYKRFTGSTVYLTNVGIGIIVPFIIGVIALFVSAESIIDVVIHDAPLEPDILIPALPIIVYMFLGMVPTTCCSPSLEGKNEWIIRSLPISQIDDYKGKCLFNLILTIPVGIFSVATLCHCFGADLVEGLASIVTIIVLCLFSTVYGLRCGLKHKRLDWNNEVEVIKQGTAVATYLIPNLIVVILLLPGIVVLNMIIENIIVTDLILCVIALGLTFLSYLGVKRFIRR